MKKVLLFFVLTFSAQVFAINPQVILQTNYGDVIVELFPENASVTVNNFLGYVNSGFYDGVIFHRTINGFMAQTGLFDSDLVAKQPDPSIINEFGLSNVRGTLAMAKLGEDPDSATSQFFINQADNSANLDFQNGGFTVFAQVIQGMDIVDIIAGVRTFWQLSPSAGWIGDVPAEPVIIEKAEIYDPATRVYVSNAGSDITGDGTYSTPYATIQKACDMAAANAHVVMSAGTYTGAGNRDIDLSSPLVIRGQSPNDTATVAATAIDCQGDALNLHRAFILSNDQFAANIKGLSITGGYHNDGAAIYAADFDVYLDNCHIAGNTATGNGGAIYCDNALSVISRTIIENNSSVNGGAVYNRDSSLNIEHSRLLNNTASNGAGVYCYNNPSLALPVEFNNTIIAYNNASANGGGIYLQSGDMLIDNCNVVYNDAVSSGRAIYGGDTATIKNSIIYGTIPSIIDGTPDVTYSDVQGGFAGLGNIDQPPLFVDAAAGDYHLQSSAWRWFPVNYGTYPQPWSNDTQTSRCIDAGDPAETDGKEVDVVVYEAVVGYRFGLNQRINIGAYGGESEASMPPFDFALESDFNNDGVVAAVDLAHFASGWILDYDMDDFLNVSENWLNTTSWYVPQ